MLLNGRNFCQEIFMLKQDISIVSPCHPDEKSIMTMIYRQPSILSSFLVLSLSMCLLAAMTSAAPAAPHPSLREDEPVVTFLSPSTGPTVSAFVIASVDPEHSESVLYPQLFFCPCGRLI